MRLLSASQPMYFRERAVEWSVPNKMRADMRRPLFPFGGDEGASQSGLGKYLTKIVTDYLDDKGEPFAEADRKSILKYIGGQAGASLLLSILYLQPTPCAGEMQSYTRQGIGITGLFFPWADFNHQACFPDWNCLCV